MFFRTVTSAVAVWLVLCAGFVQAKVSPSLEMQRQTEQRLLEILIRDSVEHGYCDAIPAAEPGVTWIPRMPLADGHYRACSIPAPGPDPLEHIAGM